MSGFTCPHCGAKIELFKSGGGERAAGDLKVPFLGRIPFEPEMVKSGDSGRPLISYVEGKGASKAIEEITDRIEEFVRNRTREGEK